MTASTFAIDVAKFCELAKANGDQVLRAVALELTTQVVQRSPVGNPELWAANKHAVYARQTYNLFAEDLNKRATIFNANLVAAGEVTKSGKIRGAQKPVKTLTAKTLAKKFPLTSGKGYTGGRFRANWFTTLEAPSTASTDSVDPSGQSAIAAAAAVVAEVHLGTVIYLTNNLPYSERLEYGYSKQAPGGMVRLAVAEFQGIVNDKVAELPST